MSKHFETDLENLQRELLALCGLVEEMIAKANRALRQRDAALAREVVEADQEVDEREVRLEEECLKILALHQPVAGDLRRVATTLKVNNDLERMADLAVNVAERVYFLVEYPEVPISETLDRMVEVTTTMVRESLDALVNLDVGLARRVRAMDDQVDALNRQVIDELVALMQRDPRLIPGALHCFSAARHLERIADHATNIAEDVVYLVEGVITRHRPLPTSGTT